MQSIWTLNYLKQLVMSQELTQRH